MHPSRRGIYLSPALSTSMGLKFKCSDVGFDCGFVAKGKTEDEILAQCATHATQDHKMKPEEITDELKSKIKANIHKSWF